MSNRAEEVSVDREDCGHHTKVYRAYSDGSTSLDYEVADGLSAFSSVEDSEAPASTTPSKKAVALTAGGAVALVEAARFLIG